MIKAVIFALTVVLIGFLLHLSIQERYESINISSEDAEYISKSTFEGPEIKVHNKAGVEWVIRGNILRMEKEWVKLENPVFVSNKGETIRSKRAELNRSSGIGNLEGDVVLEAQDLYMQTDAANMDFRNNLISGEGVVYVKDKDRIIRGKGYSITLKPRKVIIKNVYMEME